MENPESSASCKRLEAGHAAVHDGPRRVYWFAAAVFEADLQIALCCLEIAKYLKHCESNGNGLLSIELFILVVLAWWVKGEFMWCLRVWCLTIVMSWAVTVMLSRLACSVDEKPKRWLMTHWWQKPFKSDVQRQRLTNTAYSKTHSNSL